MTDGIVGHHRGARNNTSRPSGHTYTFDLYKCALIFYGGIFMKKIAVIMGSDSDLPVVKKAVNVLEEFNAPYEVHIFSAHRTPDEAAEFSRTACENGFGAIIAAAGMAAHLAGAIAANTTLPVVGIPISSGGLGGIDALLSTVQMPTGIPVATVAVNGAANAAFLCLQMLAISDPELADKILERRKSDSKAVLEKDKSVMDKLKNS